MQQVTDKRRETIMCPTEIKWSQLCTIHEEESEEREFWWMHFMGQIYHMLTIQNFKNKLGTWWLNQVEYGMQCEDIQWDGNIEYINDTYTK